jgi:nucleoside phosphorylase
MTIDPLANNLIHSLIKGFGDKSSLSEVEIWIGASSEANEIIEIVKILINTFEGLGATVNSTALNSSFKPHYEGAIVQEHICRADIILMIAATPGTSAKALDICHRHEKNKHINLEKVLVFLPGQFNQGTIYRLLCMYKVSPITLPSSASDCLIENSYDFICKCAQETIDRRNSIRVKEELHKKEFNPTIAVITALPRELRSAILILEERMIDSTVRNGIHVDFHHGQVSSACGGYHRVVIARCGAGNNKAASIATCLLERYPNVETILMVGIAGGMPDLANADRHVRLGDIVVSNQIGVVQYDMDKENQDFTEPRYLPRPPSSKWLTRCEDYIGVSIGEPSYWLFLDEITRDLKISRPRNGPLADSPWLDNGTAKHPKDKMRIHNRPKPHMGVIASANKLLKNSKLRDELKTKYNAMAVEMEGSGIADATYLAGKSFLVIRGICDYANITKNDIWQDYAAAAAAAFAKGLIKSMRL